MSLFRQICLTLCGLFLVAGTLTACSVNDTKPVAKTEPSSVPSTYLVECTKTNLTQEPVTFTLTCADGNEQLQDLKWSSWGQPTATATGSVSSNTCEPNCATGKVQKYDVTVTAKDLVATNDKQAYTKLVVNATGNQGPGAPANEEFQLMNLLGK